jgi:hypothetical protein
MKHLSKLAKQERTETTVAKPKRAETTAKKGIRRLAEIGKAAIERYRRKGAGMLMGVAIMTSRMPKDLAGYRAPEASQLPPKQKGALMESVILDNKVLRIGKTVVSSRARIEQGHHVIEINFEDGSMIRAKIRADGIKSVTMCKDGVRSSISMNDAISHISTGVMSGIGVSGPSGNDNHATRMPNNSQESSVAVFQMMNGDSIEIVGVAGSIQIEYFKP